MDRQALAERNRRLAAARHRPTRKHRLRDKLLKALSVAPIPARRADSNRLLIIRPDHLGDALLTMPAIQRLKQARPDLEIHVLCGLWTAELFRAYSQVDRVIPLPFPGFARRGAAGHPYLLALRWARRLRASAYDCAMVMRPDHFWGALLAKLAGIPRRIGYDLPGVAPFLTEALSLRHEHALEQNLRLVAAWTGAVSREGIRLSYPLQAADKAHIRERLAALGISRGRGLVCIHPGSGRSSKLWESVKWALVADKLAREVDCAIVFTGTASEAALIDEIRAGMSQPAGSIGATTIGQMAALYAGAAAVLGPDSGALHLAAAVDAPTVALFGPADPVEFAPWGDSRRHMVLTSGMACAPCRILDWQGDSAENHPCVRDISVEQVVNAASRLLSRADTT